MTEKGNSLGSSLSFILWGQHTSFTKSAASWHHKQQNIILTFQRVENAAQKDIYLLPKDVQHVLCCVVLGQLWISWVRVSMSLETQFHGLINLSVRRVYPRQRVVHINLITFLPCTIPCLHVVLNTPASTQLYAFLRGYECHPPMFAVHGG